MADALIIDACRTPRGVGKAGKGALSGIHPQQLGATVLRALAERTGINTAESMTSSGAAARRSRPRAAISDACRRSMPAMTSAPAP
jgi:acetyl-CoA acetyltransferase